MRRDGVRINHFKYRVNIRRQKVGNKSESRIVDKNINAAVFQTVIKRENFFSFRKVADNNLNICAQFVL